MPRSLLATLEGHVHDIEQPFLHADDLAVLRGDGVFETALVRGGRALKLDLHLTRLARSAERMGLPEVDPRRWAEAVSGATRAWGTEEEGVLRLVLSRGRESLDPVEREPTAFLYLSAVPEATLSRRHDGVSVITLGRGFHTDLAERAPWLLLGAKTLSYAVNMAALRYAATRGAQDVIFLDESGHVLEGPTTTVVVTSGNTLTTPVPDDRILHGTTMRALYRHAEQLGFECRAEPLTKDDLRAADGVWLTASITLASRVHTLDGEPLPRPAGAVDLSRLVDEALA